MDLRIASVAIQLFAYCSIAVAQPAPPYGLTQVHLENSIVLYWFYPQVNDTVLTAADGDPQSYLFYSSESVGARLAVGVDLTARTYAVEAIEIRLWPVDPFPLHSGDPSSPFNLRIRSRLDTSAEAAALWQSEVRSNNVDVSNWLSYPVRKRVLTDSLYLEFEWLPATPTAPLPSIVYTGGFLGSFTGHVEDGRMIWAPIADAGVLMRLRVSESDLHMDPPEEDILPDSFSVLVFDAPPDEGYGAPITMIVQDSLHVELNRAEAEGKYVVVAAWQNDLLSPKSEVIKLDASTLVFEEALPPAEISLAQNFPNPFNSETIIELPLPADVAIFDLLGRRVASIPPQGSAREGRYTFRWCGRDNSGRLVPSGVYFYRQSGSSSVGKMLLLK